MNEWWVVSVMLRRWSGWTSALQAARDLYATNNPKLVGSPGHRSPYSHTPPRREEEWRSMIAERFCVLRGRAVIDRPYNICWWTAAALHRALPLARRVTY